MCVEVEEEDDTGRKQFKRLFIKKWYTSVQASVLFADCDIESNITQEKLIHGFELKVQLLHWFPNTLVCLLSIYLICKDMLNLLTHVIPAHFAFSVFKGPP